MNPTNALLLENAKRLLEDAKVLRKGRRYATATALAVLSLEESGKYILATGLFSRARGSRTPNLRSHKSKQRAAAGAFIASMGIDEVRDIFEAGGYEMRVVPMREGEEVTPSEEEILSIITDEEYDAHAAPKIRNSVQNKFVLWAAQGKFDDIKKRSLYVDLSETGDLLSTPGEIRRDTSDRILRLASRVLSTIAVQSRRESRRASGGTHSARKSS